MNDLRFAVRQLLAGAGVHGAGGGHAGAGHRGLHGHLLGRERRAAAAVAGATGGSGRGGARTRAIGVRRTRRCRTAPTATGCARRPASTAWARTRRVSYTLTGQGEPRAPQGGPDHPQRPHHAGDHPRARPRFPGRGGAAVAGDQRGHAGPRVLAAALRRSRRCAGRAHRAQRAARSRWWACCPSDSALPSEVEIFTPLGFSEGDRRADQARWLEVFGRLRPGVTAAQARAELDAIAGRVAAERPGRTRVDRRDGAPDGRHGGAGVGLAVVAAGGGRVPAAHRLRQRGPPAAGPGRERGTASWRCDWPWGRAAAASSVSCLIESLVLALLGGALGMWIAQLGLQALLSLAPDTLPRAPEIRVDGGVLAFTLLLALGRAWGSGCCPRGRPRTRRPPWRCGEADPAPARQDPASACATGWWWDRWPPR